jgi:hypothetical protein
VSVYTPTIPTPVCQAEIFLVKMLSLTGGGGGEKKEQRKREEVGGIEIKE